MQRSATAETVMLRTGFALVGGPARQDAPKAIEALTKLNVPYLVSLPLVFQTTEEWLDSELGVHPVQVALQVNTLAPHPPKLHPLCTAVGFTLDPPLPLPPQLPPELLWTSTAGM